MRSTGIAQARSLLQVTLLCGSAIVLPSLTRAQNTATLSGLVTDASETPVFGAVVEIAASSLRTRTNERGEFRITGIPAGAVEIQFRRLGFAPVARIARINPNESPSPLHIVLPSLPTTVKPVVVQASRVEYTGRLAGYYERLHRRSSGAFIARDMIDRRSNKTLSQLLAATPGVSALRLRSGGGVRMRGRRCRPLVWLDGVPLPAGEVDLDAFPVSTLHGIEVYLGSTTAPMAYTASQGLSSCGTILLWSRGRDTEQTNSARRRSIDLEELAASRTVYTPDQVDKQAELAQQPLEVSYPPALFASGIVGSAVAEFVVDAKGEIEPGSFEIFSATHPLFGEAVMQALSRAHYNPAVKDGVAVRQLVHQPFSFARGAARTSASAQD